MKFTFTLSPSHINLEFFTVRMFFSLCQALMCVSMSYTLVVLSPRLLGMVDNIYCNAMKSS